MKAHGPSPASCDCCCCLRFISLLPVVRRAASKKKQSTMCTGTSTHCIRIMLCFSTRGPVIAASFSVIVSQSLPRIYTCNSEHAAWFVSSVVKSGTVDKRIKARMDPCSNDIMISSRHITIMPAYRLSLVVLRVNKNARTSFSPGRRE